MRQSIGERIFSLFNTIFLSVMILITIYPLYFCLIASFSDPIELSMNPGAILLPFTPFTLSAYSKVINHSLFVSGFRNTIYVVVVGTLINMALTIISAYVLSRKGLMLNRVLTFFIIFTMYFSGGLIPGYLNVRSLGMINSLWALILPGAISTYNLIIMRTAFKGVPDALSESAQIDGARHFTVMSRILMPVCLPTIAVLVLYYAVGHWNAWFGASIFLQDATKHPIQLVMRLV